MQDIKCNRSACQGCPLYQAPLVTFDSNRQDYGPVDVVFVGLNPGRQEAAQGIPFVGRAGEYLRHHLATLLAAHSWMITNILLCYSPNQSALGGPQQIEQLVQRCRPMRHQVLQRFPSRIYAPMGSVAARALGCRQGILKAAGSSFAHPENPELTIVPLVHPSAAMQYRGQRETAFQQGLAHLSALLTGGEGSDGRW